MEVLTEMQANGARLSNFVQNLLTYATLKVDRFEMQYEAGDINAACARSPRFGRNASRTRLSPFIFLPSEKLRALPLRLLQSAAHRLQSAG